MVNEWLGSDTRRILLVEGHKPLAGLLRETLGTVPGVSVVAEIRSADEAVAAVGAVQAELVIMDLHLPDLCGLEALSLLQENRCGAKIILLIDEDDVRYHQAAWLRGAAACVGKDNIAQDLVAVVLRVLENEPSELAPRADNTASGAA